MRVPSKRHPGNVVSDVTIMKSTSRVFVAVVLCSCFQFNLYGQSVGVAIGRVLDQTEAVIPGVTVELLSRGARAPQTTITNADGVYRFEGIPTGAAELTFRL